MLIIVFLILLPITILLLLSNIFIYSSYSQQAWKPVSPFRWVLAFVLPLLICQWGMRRKHLSQSGAVAAFLIGFVMTMSSYSFMTSMIAFFLAGSRITKWRCGLKRKFEHDYNAGRRSWIQVVCNGGVAAQLALIYLVDSGAGEQAVDFKRRYSSSWLAMSVLGALACCAGDTFASEVGSATGIAQPWLITSFRRVPRGTNGGVSVVGTLASAFGGFLIGLLFFLTQFLCIGDDMAVASPDQWPIIVVGALSGLLGSIVDSLLGATLQYSGLKEETGCVVERPGDGVVPISGYPLLNNHGVNLVASVILCVLTPQISLGLWAYLV